MSRPAGRATPPRWTGPRAAPVLALLLLLLLASAAVGVAVGSVAVSPAVLIGALWRALPLTELEPWWQPTDEKILLWIRLPRVVAAGGVGAALATAGVLFQGLLRNPLADPFIIGSSGGAAMGAATGAIMLSLQISFLGFGIVPILGFAGSFGAVWIVYGLSRYRGRTNISGLILAGFAIGSVAGAINALLILVSDQLQIRAVQTFAWLLGGVSVNGWSQVLMITPATLATVAVAFLLTGNLNAMAIGEGGAARIGINVERTKLMVLAVGSLLTALAVSISGLVAFVGLIIPHAIRLLIGPNNRLLLPAAAIGGAAYLILMDVLARTLLAPVELPVGIFTAIVGSPFFILLLRRARGSYDF